MSSRLANLINGNLSKGFTISLSVYQMNISYGESIDIRTLKSLNTIYNLLDVLLLKMLRQPRSKHLLSWHFEFENNNKKSLTVAHR